MNHLDDGTLQAFLDDELPSRERAEAAEHMMACATCRGSHDELRRANSLFSEVVAQLDRAPTAAEPPPALASSGQKGGRRFGTGSFVKAAGLLLFLAAAAAAAVPGSPVRELIERAVTSRPEPAAPAPAAPAAVTADAAPAGISVLPAASGIEVQIDGSAASIRLQDGAGESLTVSVRGAEVDPTFRSGPGEVGVRGGVGGEVLVELPPTLRSARLVVDGRLYAEVVDGELRIREPAERLDGAVIWR